MNHQQQRETAMENIEAQRTIGALKAIIQTVMPELYSALGKAGSKANFYQEHEHHDLIATAIANELTENEIDEAFGWNERASSSAEAEMRETPIVPYLRPEQAKRFRDELDAII